VLACKKEITTHSKKEVAKEVLTLHSHTVTGKWLCFKPQKAFFSKISRANGLSKYQVFWENPLLHIEV